MMRLTYLVFLLFLSSLGASTYAQPFKQFHSCDTKEKAINCTGCIPIPGRVRFLVEKSRGFVLQQAEGGQVGNLGSVQDRG